MNASRFVVAAVAAASVIGVIGIAAAQSTAPAPTGGASAPEVQPQTTPMAPTAPMAPMAQVQRDMGSTTTTAPADSTIKPMPTPTDQAMPGKMADRPASDGSMSTERAARPDRN